MHRMDKCSPQPVQSPEGCLSFSWSWRISYSGSVNFGSAAFCFGGRGTSLVTVGGLVAYSTTIHAEVIGQTTLSLLLRKFTIFCKGIGDGRLGGGGGTRGLVRLVIRVLLHLLRFTSSKLQLTLGVLRFLLRFVVIGLIGLVRMGFLTESFPMTLIECVRFFNSVRVEGLPTWPMMSLMHSTKLE